MNNSRLKTRIGSAFALLLAVFILTTQIFSVVSYADTDTAPATETAETVKNSETEKGTEVAAESESSAVTENAETTAKDAKDETAAETEEEKSEFKNSYNPKGIWQTLSIPFGYVVYGAYQVIHDYGVVLLFFAIVMKVILFPFGIKQQKNSVKQASLRPKEMAIRKKYAGRNDKPTQQKMQQEVMELYQRENFNPMGGCLPLLLQFPILFALYQVVYNPLRHIMHLTTDVISDLAQKVVDLGIASVTRGDIDIVSAIVNCTDKSKVAAFNEYAATLGVNADKFPSIKMFGIDLSGTPNFGENIGLIWIPIVTFITVFFSMKLTKKMTYQPIQNTDAGKSGIIMDLVMPLMSTWFTFLFPGILGVYWIFQNLLGIVQQFILKKMYPLPEFTEEDYTKAQKEMSGKEQKKKKTASAHYKRHPKSLHHIDDDDDDEVQANTNTSKSRKTPVQGIVPPAEMKEDIPHSKLNGENIQDKD